MRRWFALLALALAPGCRPTVEPEPERPHVGAPPAQAKLVDGAVASLRALGFEVDVEGFAIDSVSEAKAKAEMSRRTDALWPAKRLQRLHALAWLLVGNGVLAVDAEVLREAMHVGAARPTVAYYAPKRIVFIEKEQAKLVPRDLILTHELVHAYQDQQLDAGVFARLEGADTLDELWVAQLAIEGHAQFVGMVAFLQRRGIAAADVPASMFNAGTMRLTSPSAALLYEQGALAMLAAHREGGWAAVDDLWRTPPLTTEQMLHPRKLGRDPPTEIAAPVIEGATLRWDDTVGEILLRVLLAQHMDEAKAVVAAIGWDGDRLALYDTEQGPLLVWRTAWDRPVDGAQFIGTLLTVPTLSATSVFKRRGQIVDVVVTAPPATGADAQRVCDGLPPLPQPRPDSARQTAAVETDYAARVAAQARVVRGRFEVQDSGVRIPIPKGWQALRIRGTNVLRAPVVEGFGDNVVVATGPNLLGFTLDQVEKATVEQLRDVLGSQVLRNERRTVGGRPALLLEVLGHEAGSTVVLHQLIVVFFTKTHRVILTLSARPDRWERLAPVFEQLVDGIEPQR